MRLSSNYAKKFLSLRDNIRYICGTFRYLDNRLNIKDWAWQEIEILWDAYKGDI